MTLPRYQWQPTTEEIAKRAGIARDQVIRFDQNTTPFRTPWAQELAALEVGRLNDYPGADYRSLRKAAAAFTDLDPTQIIPGAGADELILLCGKAFLDARRKAVQIAPAYPLYRISTAQVGAALTVINSTPPKFLFPTEAAVSAARTADLVWLCVPNNPTGTTASQSDVEAVIAATNGIVVLDAAYAEFSDLDWSATVRRSRNLIVLRTLSKAFGLAGARVGFAMAQKSLIESLDGVRPPVSITSISAAIGTAVLRAPAKMRQYVADTIAARTDLEIKLTDLGWKVLPSKTNFLLSDVGPEATTISNALMQKGLVVRTFPYDPLKSHIRVTVRTPTDHDRLVNEIRRIIS